MEKKSNIMKAKLVNESMFGGYDEAEWQMDKFLPETQELQDEYYEILDDEDMDDEEKIEVLADFIENNCEDEERMYSYFPENGSIYGLAAYIISQQIG